MKKFYLFYFLLASGFTVCMDQSRCGQPPSIDNIMRTIRTQEPQNIVEVTQERVRDCATLLCTGVPQLIDRWWNGKKYPWGDKRFS